MTSWLHTRAKPKSKSEEGPKVRDYFLNLEGGDFATYYLSLFNAQVYSNANNRSLNVYDRANPVSVSYPLLKEAFEPVANVNYVSEMMTGVTILSGQSDQRYTGLLTRLSKDELRAAALRILKWSPTILQRVAETLKEQGLETSEQAASFDVGVHIRPRNRFDAVRAPNAASYVTSVEDIARRLKRTDLSVFVLTSELADFIEFQRAAPPTWKLFQVQPSNATIRGSNVSSFNRQNSAVKLNAYIEHVSELYCMQHCDAIIGSLTTNIGRFLYLTAPDPNAFRSIDTQVYS